MSLKRYYWLRLKTDFFNSKEILKLRSIAGGDTYTIIYLKMMLLSLPNDGLIPYDGIGGTPEEEVSMVLHESKENVQVAIQILKSLGLVVEVEGGDMMLEQVQDLTGSESKSAEKMRRKRKRDNAKLLLTSTNCNDVTCKESQCDQKVTLEKDIDIELELDNREIHCRERQCLSDEVAPYKAVIERLNELTGSHFRDSTQSTRRLIKARLAEGFTVADLITVIEKMVAAWKGTEMEQYLRPSTLFNASKFEGYLNRKEVQTVDERIRAVQEAYEGGEDVDTGDIPY